MVDVEKDDEGSYPLLGIERKSGFFSSQFFYYLFGAIFIASLALNIFFLVDKYDARTETTSATSVNKFRQ